MESKPHVEARPPALIESAVRLLVPPVAREHVLGDLAERYSSHGQYVIEAARTIPVVVASQIRRTSDFLMWPIVAVILTIGFAIGTGTSWLLAALPALAAMIGFMFRDAYRVLDLRHPWRQPLVDVTVAAGSALASQAAIAIVRPDWLIAPDGIAGGGIALALLYLLRVQNPAGRVLRFASASPRPPMTFDQLRGEMAIYDRITRRSMRIEIVTGYVMLPVLAASALFANSPVVRIGGALSVAGVFFVIWYLRRRLNATMSIPTEADFAATLAVFRARLERHHDALRTMWLWYLLPLGIGPAVIFSAAAMAQARPAAAIGPLVGFAVVLISVAWLSVHNARALRHRITAIEQVKELR